MLDLIKNSKELLDLEIKSRKFYLEKLENATSTKNILVISGQRRVGKSYIILDYLKSKKINSDKIFYLNKELDFQNQIKDSLVLDSLFSSFVNNFGEPEFLIIDEIQDIEKWENFIRAKFTSKKYKIIIIGSNSKLLSSELSTYLTGRYLQIDILPLSYFEYLDFAGIQISKESFLNYLQFGGLPEVILESNLDLKKNYIENLKNSILLKDIVTRYKIRDFSFFEKILSFLSQNIGNTTSLRKIEDYLKKDKIKISLATISNYLKFLQNTFLINECEKVDLTGKKVLEYNSKYYFNDLGIRNSIYYNFNFDIGKLLENYVFNSLLKNGYKVFVGDKSGLEIDFVAEKEGNKIYFQVCYLISDEKVYEREFGNLKKIKDNFKKFVLSLDEIEFKDDFGIEHKKVFEIEGLI